MALTSAYRARHQGWSAKHYYTWYRRAGGKRSYTWVKRQLQKAELVVKAPRRGAHRKRRDRAPLPGMLLHQDGSDHEWVPGQRWDLIVTMDDATSEHYAMEFVEEEGTHSSFSGVAAVISAHGLFSALYTDRGSHYWFTPEAGGKIDRRSPTQFGRAMQQLGIEMIAAYSPPGPRPLRARVSHAPGSAAEEIALAGISEMAAANRYLKQHYLPAYNAEFRQPSLESGSAFVPCAGTNLKEILCEHFERRVGPDNCASFEDARCRSRRSGTAAISSRPRRVCIGISMTPWRCSMAPDAWLATRRTGSSLRIHSVLRKVRSRRHAGSGSPGFALRP